MQKIFNTIVDLNASGIDTYQHNGSTWLIFTETKQWVIEYTEDRTLWYNYSFFNNLSGYISVEDPNEIKDYVKNWFELRFLSKPNIGKALYGALPSHKFNEIIENLPFCNIQISKFVIIQIHKSTTCNRLFIWIPFRYQIFKFIN